MTTIELKDPYFYKDGKGGVSGVVGYESRTHRVARCIIQAPQEGAYGVTLTIQTSYLEGGENATAIPLRFFIGTEPESHANAGPDSVFHGEMTRYTDNNKPIFTGSADIVLLPNQTYYVWIFPGEDKFGWYFWETNRVSTLEILSPAGLINLGNGSELESYQPYVFNGTDWDLLMPYLGNGSSYDLCTQ